MLAITAPVLLSAADLGTAATFGLVGIAMTVGAVMGIIALAKRFGPETSTGQRVASVLGIGCLAVFALFGVLLTGCGATIAAH